MWIAIAVAVSGKERAGDLENGDQAVQLALEALAVDR